MAKFAPPPRVYRPFVVAALAVACFGSAACDRPRAGVTEHPLPGRFEGEDIAAPIGRDTIPRGMNAEAVAAWTSARDAILAAHSVVAIGVEGVREDDPAIFGAISDVAVDARGFVYVLDGQSQYVKIFDAAGRLADSFGGIGDGPTELRYAIAIELLANGRVLVVSKGIGVRVFASSADGWHVEEARELPFGLWAFCRLPDGRMYGKGFDDEVSTLVREVSLSHEEVIENRFGEAYRHDEWLVQWNISEGPVACAGSAPPLVVLGSHTVPIIRAFDAMTGSLQWAARLDDFMEVPLYNFTNDLGYRATQWGRRDEWDTLRGIEPVADGYLLLQVVHGEEEQESVSLHSYLLDAASGAGAFIGEEVPRALPWANGYVALFDEPFPRLEVREYGSSNTQARNQQ